MSGLLDALDPSISWLLRRRDILAATSGMEALLGQMVFELFTDADSRTVADSAIAMHTASMLGLELNQEDHLGLLRIQSKAGILQALPPLQRAFDFLGIAPRR